MIAAVSPVQAQRDYGVHDPTNIVKDGDTYFTFYTSMGVECATSTDNMCTWRRGGRVFASGSPSWINQYVSNFGGHFWAPEVVFMNNRWHVYYSCSSFGKPVSAIGVATSPSLKNPQWEDQGMVVSSDNSSGHNAIDADVMLTSDGRAFLIFGSYWAGIMMTELDTLTGKPKDRDSLVNVAGGNPEAGAAIQHGDYYYLFFNRGKCCEGVNSTYEIFVGRSTDPLGPYMDKDSTPTTGRGGGTLLLTTEGRFIGPGHFGYFAENGREYMSYHYYDGNQNGWSKLKITGLAWEDGWPVVKDYDVCNPVSVERNVRQATKKSPVTYRNGIVYCYAENEGRCSLRLYSCSGQLLRKVVSDVVERGAHRIKLNILNLSKGSFILVVTVGANRYEKLICNR